MGVCACLRRVFVARAIICTCVVGRGRSGPGLVWSLSSDDCSYRYSDSSVPFPVIASLVQWDVVEADSYWSLTRLLDGLQDNYTFAQPGIQRTVFKLREIMHKVPLAPARQP